MSTKRLGASKIRPLDEYSAKGDSLRRPAREVQIFLKGRHTVLSFKASGDMRVTPESAGDAHFEKLCVRIDFL